MRINDKVLAFSPSSTLTADTTSDWFWLGHLTFYSIQVVWTGTPVGNFTLECSNDGGQPAGSNYSGSGTATAFPVITNFDTVTGSTIAAGGAAGKTTYNASNVAYRWVRVKYTFGSSTGTASAIANGKGPN